MPTTSNANDKSNAHIQEAKDNYARYQRLLNDEADVDWALIVLFYVAVHLVQSHAVRHAPQARGEVVPTNHQERNGYVSRQLTELYTPYMQLLNVSKEARYELKKRTREEVISLHDGLFEPLRTAIAKRGIVL